MSPLNPLDSKVPHRIIRSWYTGRWWVGCYIWYSYEGPGRAAAPPSPLFAVPNDVTAHPSTASVPITVLLHDVPLLCGFNVAIKGWTVRRGSISRHMCCRWSMQMWKNRRRSRLLRLVFDVYSPGGITGMTWIPTSFRDIVLGVLLSGLPNHSAPRPPRDTHNAVRRVRGQNHCRRIYEPRHSIIFTARCYA